MSSYQPQPSAPVGQPRNGPVILGVVVALAVLTAIAFAITFAVRAGALGSGEDDKKTCACLPPPTTQVSTPIQS